MSLPSPQSIQRAFDGLARRPFRSIDAGEPARAALLSLGARPELRPLLDDTDVRLRPALDLPFRTLDGHTIELQAALLDQPALAAVHLRHAAELVLGYRIAPDPNDPPARMALAILACHATLRYMESLAASEHVPLWRAAPLLELLRDLPPAGDGHVSRRNTVIAIGRHLPHLLPLQNVAADRALADESARERAYALAEDGLPVALPTERLLTLGGDSRLWYDPRTGLNGYGCSASPRPWAITFSTCTASSVSDLGYQVAETARCELLAASLTGQGLYARAGESTEAVRGEIARILDLERVPGTRAILAASGTDCELYAVYAALVGHGGPVVNIVIAPQEIGSGSLPAARGLHFDRLTPLGREVQAGTPLAGLTSERVEVACLDLRDEHGAPVALDDIDQRLVPLVDAAVARGGRALIHLLDSSKTGLRAPSLCTVRALQRQHGASVLVVVDAAQLRVDRDGIAEYLENGFMVIVSGSKFYTGAPFSGALLVPPRIVSFALGAPAPAGLSDYASRWEIPPCWPRFRADLLDVPNLGLLLRWRTALWEMRAFEAVPGPEQHEYFEEFSRAFRAALARHPHCELVEATVRGGDPSLPPPRWDRLQTIFTFLVKQVDTRSGGALPLLYEDARLVYGWLNRDVSALLPAASTPQERAVAGTPCHIGQPVRIGGPGGVWLGGLRIAVGARFVSRVHFDPTLGRSVPERLAAQVRAAEMVLEKISTILRYWNALRTQSAPRPSER